jgi:NitT/TauT family transport system permease protein/sulfonate transport system permease protein
MWAFACGVVASGVPLEGHWQLILCGIALAGPFVCATSQAVNDWFDRHVDAINEPGRPIPSGRIPGYWGLYIAIGWTLLSVIWFGVSSFTVVFTIVVVLLPFAIVNLREGLLALDAEITEMGTSFGRRPLRSWRLLVVPALLPMAAATLRIMFGVAWKVTLTAELFGGGRGLGYLINMARQDYDTATIFAVILFIIVVVTLADRLLFAPLERLTARQFASAA